MILVMKKNFKFNQKIILKCSPHKYWGALKKKPNTCKNISSTWTLFLKLLQILGPIQVLARNLKKHNYNN